MGKKLQGKNGEDFCNKERRTSYQKKNGGLSGAAARTGNLYKNRVRRYIYNKDGGWDFKIKIFKFLKKLRKGSSEDRWY